MCLELITFFYSGSVSKVRYVKYKKYRFLPMNRYEHSSNLPNVQWLPRNFCVLLTIYQRSNTNMIGKQLLILYYFLFQCIFLQHLLSIRILMELFMLERILKFKYYLNVKIIYVINSEILKYNKFNTVISYMLVIFFNNISYTTPVYRNRYTYISINIVYSSP